MVCDYTVKAGIAMTPEEFDISFDFDKEYDDTPRKSSFDDDFDLDAALERELGADFDRLFEEEFAASQAELNAQIEAKKQKLPTQVSQDTAVFSGFAHLADDEEDDEEPAAPAQVPDDDPDEDLSAVFAAVTAAKTEAAPQPQYQPVPEPAPASPSKKEQMQAVGRKCLNVTGAALTGFGRVMGENFRLFAAGVKEIKPGKMDRKAMRRFKNDVLPMLIGGASLLVCLLFIIGSMSRGFNSEDRKQAALEASIAQAQAEAAAAAEIQDILTTAARQAAGYDYQAAINTLDSYKTDDRELTEEMVSARASYAEAVNTLVVWDDPTAIPNLSFHVLIADPTRAYASDLAGAYRSNFITTAQFSAILEQLYAKGYVLVNLDSCLTTTTAADGSVTCAVQPMYLPEGKKPIMITETLVNYFGYMVDSNNDGTPDAGGSGFASRLVARNGKVVAEYVDAQGNTQVGDYDLVPILTSPTGARKPSWLSPVTRACSAGAPTPATPPPSPTPRRWWKPSVPTAIRSLPTPTAIWTTAPPAWSRSTAT